MRADVIRVVKLGGSLFDDERLAARLEEWLARQSPAGNVLIAGGGALVECVRDFDRRHQLAATTAHWLAIQAMSLSAGMLADILPGATRVTALSDVGALGATARPIVFDPAAFLRDEEPALAGFPLPASWDVTSDSIAARVAQALGACELALLKSTLPQGVATRDEAAQHGYVDRFFPQAAMLVDRVRAVDLLRPDYPQRVLAK